MITINCTLEQVSNIGSQVEKKYGLEVWRRIVWNGSALEVPDDLAAQINSLDLNKLPVPDVVALWQARAALRQAGQFAAVDAYVQSHMNDSPALYEAWEYGNQVSRTGEFVSALGGPQFGLTEQQIDDLFRAAAAIRG